MRIPPYGPLSAEIAFVGQSPGKQEQLQGRPFVGPAGKMLREICTEVGIDPEAAYYTNICDRVLLGSEEPTPEDIGKGRIRLRDEIAQLTKLKLIVLVGIFAARLVFFGLMREMSGMEGVLFGHPCTAVYHPSATLRARNKRQAEWTRGEIKRVLSQAARVESPPSVIRPTRSSGVAVLLGSRPETEAPAERLSAAPTIESDNWLRILLDETLERQQPLWEEPVRHFRASEVGDSCLRSLCLSAMGHRMPIEARLRRIFNTGLAIEKSNVHTLNETGLADGYATQAVVEYDEPPILGHTDVLMRRPSDNKQLVGEIKCVAPEARILCADLSWVPAEALKPGDEILSFDEERAIGQGKPRKLRRAKVISNECVELPAYQVQFASGKNISVSGDHLWLMVNKDWKSTEELLADKQTWKNRPKELRVRRWIDPWEEDCSKEAWYLQAAFEGEGCVCQTKKALIYVNFSQAENAMLKKVEILLNEKKYPFRKSTRVTSSGKLCSTLWLQGVENKLRFLGQIRPQRLLDNFFFDGFGARPRGSDEITAIVSLGEQKLQALKTSAGTLFVEGLFAHNSINEAAFKRLPSEHGPTVAGESPLYKSHYKYIMQWNCYAGAPNLGLNEGFILFESKDKQNQKFYWLLRDDALLESTLVRLRLAAPYILSDPMRVPPTLLEPDDDPAHTKCPRRYLCSRIPAEGADYDTVRAIDAQLRG